MQTTGQIQKIMGREYDILDYAPDGREPMQMVKVIEPHTKTHYYVSLAGAKAFKSEGARFPLPENIKRDLIKNLGQDFVTLPKQERLELIEQSLLCMLKDYYGAEYLEEFDDSHVGNFTRNTKDSDLTE
jgi:hypothetical protein